MIMHVIPANAGIPASGGFGLLVGTPDHAGVSR